jgi:hypothetical protein
MKLTNHYLACGIASIGITTLATLTAQVPRSQAAEFVTNGNFAPTTIQPTTIRWGADNPSALGPSAANQTIVNGWTSEGYNFLVPTGNGIDTNNTPNVRFYGSNLNAPNSAGYFVAADSAFQSGRIYQNLTGLVVGEQYIVSFYQAAAQQNGFVYDPNAGPIDPNTGQPTGGPSTTTRYSGDTTDNWIVNVGGTYTAPALSNGYDNANTTLTSSFAGGTTYVSPTMSLRSQRAAGAQTYASGNGTIVEGTGATVNPVSTVSVGWQQDSFAFTATDSNTTLSFLSQGTPTGKPPFALLTGVSVQGAQPLPEPLDYLGTLVGGAAAFMLRKKLKSLKKQ